MGKNEIRQNKATKQWVLYAPSRSKRPTDFREEKNGRKKLPEHDDNCPFCRGNENMLPGIITEVPENNQGEWKVRVVPNKFAALTPKGDSIRRNDGIYVTMNGYGRHEVIIEHPKHNQDIATMAQQETNAVIEMYHKRYLDLIREHENMLTLIFRNHGKRAGTSLAHPHSQVIVTSFVPHYIRWREEEAQHYFDEWGRCVFCDILEFEEKSKRRIVNQKNNLVAFIPFHAEVPFEIWIMPKKHQADFGNISDKEKIDLAEMLHELLFKLYDKLNDPDYNYIINTSTRYKAGEPQLHWYLQIRPRLTTQAGFEIGSGICINPSIPEDDADFLNGIK
jgi:UDPglucose--hexose-1-phosphate uridylyltransferase